MVHVCSIQQETHSSFDREGLIPHEELHRVSTWSPVTLCERKQCQPFVICIQVQRARTAFCAVAALSNVAQENARLHSLLWPHLLAHHHRVSMVVNA